MFWGKLHKNQKACKKQSLGEKKTFPVRKSITRSSSTGKTRNERGEKNRLEKQLGLGKVGFPTKKET